MTTNTPSEQPAIPEGWRPLGEAPPATPVIVQYRQWNLPCGEVREQVAWLHNHRWRTYPRIDDEAYADFWRPMSGVEHPAQASEVERLREAEQLFRMLVANDDEAAPNGLMDCIDNDGHPYQSAAMAGLITHVRMWLEPNALADRCAAYRASLNPSQE